MTATLVIDSQVYGRRAVFNPPGTLAVAFA